MDTDNSMVMAEGRRDRGWEEGEQRGGNGDICNKSVNNKNNLKNKTKTSQIPQTPNERHPALTCPMPLAKQPQAWH